MGREVDGLGDRIKSLRKINKMSMPVLAEKLNISDSYLKMIERGKRVPSLYTLIDISMAFGVSLDFLIFGYTEKPLADMSSALFIDDEDSAYVSLDQFAGNLDKQSEYVKRATVPADLSEDDTDDDDDDSALDRLIKKLERRSEYVDRVTDIFLKYGLSKDMINLILNTVEYLAERVYREKSK